jgi:hypothetical protein
MHIGRKTRAWTAALGLALVGLAASASLAQALPPNFWGVVPQSVLTLEQVQRLHRGGVQSERIPVDWNAVQPYRGGAFDWSGIDDQVEAAARAGVAIFPFLANAPSWAVPSVYVPGSGHSVTVPARLPVSGGARAGWTSFLTAAVARYGPDGTFWSENPSVPKRPIRIWQIWNEENFKYFIAEPNPAEYGQLVKISYTALKAADPGAKVILGGMFARPKEALSRRKPPLAYFATDFLSQMYQRTPGIRSKFNGVALHPYTPKFQELPADITAFRSVLAANHDAGKGLWITELGWSSKGKSAANSYAKGPAGQATQLNGAFSLLKSHQRQWNIRGLYWFSVDDNASSCNFCDGSGLFGEGFIPKKSWYSYVKFAGGTP